MVGIIGSQTAGTQNVLHRQGVKGRVLRSSTYLNFRIFKGSEIFSVFQTLYDYTSYYPCENYTNLDATNRQPREKGTSTYQLDFSLGLLSGRKLATSQTAIQKVRLLPPQKAGAKLSNEIRKIRNTDHSRQ